MCSKNEFGCETQGFAKKNLTMVAPTLARAYNPHLTHATFFFSPKALYRTSVNRDFSKRFPWMLLLHDFLLGVYLSERDIGPYFPIPKDQQKL